MTNGEKMAQLCRLLGDDGLEVITPTSALWDEWVQWRHRNQVGTSYMLAQDKWTVPAGGPPENIDQAIEDAMAAKRFDRRMRRSKGP